MKITLAHFINLIQQKHCITPPRFPQSLDDQPGSASDVRAAMASDLGLVTHAAEGDTLEGSVERTCNGLPEGSFSSAWGADEAVRGAGG